MSTEISENGEVTVEGEYVGRLTGFRFQADPRVTSSSALEGKALRAAATKALEPEIASRASRLLQAAGDSIEIRSDGTLWWEGGLISRLVAAEEAIRPSLDLISDALMPAATREQLVDKLEVWLNAHIESTLEPLFKLKEAVNTHGKSDDKAPISGLARGIGFQLVESLGFLNRAQVQDEIKSLDQPARSQLRKLGVRFGEFSIYMPTLLKPACAKLLVLLDSINHGHQKDGNFVESLPAGLTSLAADRRKSHGFYNAAGFAVVAIELSDSICSNV